MAPKPFPFPLGIGIDVCKSVRIVHFLQSSRLSNQWARKVFTRLEWPDLLRQFESTRLQMVDVTGDAIRIDRNSMDTRYGWLLPDIPIKGSNDDLYGIRSRETVSGESLIHEHTPTASLIGYLAGRYAIFIYLGRNFVLTERRCQMGGERGRD